ncbi:P-loop containing nucleoside triphosphate hydrolase protein [Panus rudis PR-1116 ss-1]|nr:P-loop containing nucleoside triphosphate hydrolase protein [Panus rudis PR-1116 ss-1]
MRGFKRKGPSRPRKGVFNPEDTAHVKHVQYGVWDVYEEINPALENIPGSSKVERLWEMKQDLPYVWWMLKDISSIRSCWLLLLGYAIIELILSLVPATALWYRGQLLRIVQTAVDERSVDRRLLFQVTLGSIGCKLLQNLLNRMKNHLTFPLSSRLKRHYSVHLFRARARLDVPTYESEAVQAQLEAASHTGNGQSVAWSTLTSASYTVSSAIQLFSQFSVLWNVLKGQMDGPLLATLAGIHALTEVFKYRKLASIRSGVWAATTRNEDFIKLQGMKRLVSFPEHRKEFVAGNLAEFTSDLFKKLTERVGDGAGDFWEVFNNHKRTKRLSILGILEAPLSEMPQIAFALRAVQYPTSIPVSLTTLHLVSSTVQSFAFSMFRLFDQTDSVADHIASVRKLYDILKVPNIVVDGTVPFPEDKQKVKSGISLEFRNVSFKYPGAQEYALRDVSFKLEQGQLCVIVGSNGSGKSTILKLIVRLYDVDEGTILIDGKDIRTLKLADLRETISVLFQDYTIFPLSIRDNIAFGDPQHAEDEDRIRLAAKLGGSEEFIEKLPEGFSSYLERPVKDHYGGLPEGTKTLFGRPVDYSGIRGAGGMSTHKSISLSGGQMQRLAVSRTFMRSVVSDDSPVGLLLFDEPSASLDPTAEHDLFARLRQLRGNKTMLFSSHRFGNLTRHADLILYMNDSRILETGTHDELLKLGGDYARIWGLQAQAFL